MRRLSWVLLCLAAWLPLAAQPSPQATSQFQTNLQRYLSTTSGFREKLRTSSSVSEIHHQRLQLADGIRQVRASAKQGEIFTPEVGAMFAQLLATTLNAPEGKRIRASLRHAEPVQPVQLTVDAKYPDNIPLQSTPPSLLLNLPRLPRGMEYRIVGRSLVLRDEDADTIADYLPDALPASVGASR